MGQDSWYLLWIAPLLDVSGLAEDARQLILAADRAGIPLRVDRIPWKNLEIPLNPDQRSRLEALQEIRPQGRMASIFHFFPPHFSRVPEARINIGRITFESDRLPESWQKPCQEMDRLWVPSTFNRERFATSGIPLEKIQVLPETLDVELFGRDHEPYPFRQSLGFTFLSSFVWQLRKGWDVLLKAFAREFRGEEGVTLLLKVFLQENRPPEELEKQIEEFLVQEARVPLAEVPRIEILREAIPASELPRLYHSADAFVLPTRGEGWGRPLMEAMASGLPTLATNWSGHLDFMNQENSWLIDSELVPVSEEVWSRTPEFQGHRWAEPSVEDLQKKMRDVFSHPQEAREKAERARQEILSHLGPERIGQKLVQLLAELT